ncbi:helix-turn-helix domain-containing protein [Amycolatopsis sp. cmx-11-32]|uniref:helix-turn-helix domain-containing protein n=1 Tax=Amycolatopsis sp. cmx-11-32 TaxID=2785796 RepID=UPI0039E57961
MPTERDGRHREPSVHRTATPGQEAGAVHDLDRLTAATRTGNPPPWSRDSLHALGVTTDLLTAARILRIGRTKAYQLAKCGGFPVPATRIGRHYVVAVAHLADLLGLGERASS